MTPDMARQMRQRNTYSSGCVEFSPRSNESVDKVLGNQNASSFEDATELVFQILNRDAAAIQNNLPRESAADDPVVYLERKHGEIKPLARYLLNIALKDYFLPSGYVDMETATASDASTDKTIAGLNGIEKSAKHYPVSFIVVNASIDLTPETIERTLQINQKLEDMPPSSISIAYLAPAGVLQALRSDDSLPAQQAVSIAA